LKVLRDYLRDSLDALGEDRDLALALLDEHSAAVRLGMPPDTGGVCRRTDASGADLQRVAARLQGARLLTPCEDGRRELVPPELAAVVESEVAEVTEPSRRLLRQGLDAWREVGGLLPPENFAAVHRQAALLRPAREEIEFLVRCGIQHAGESGLGPAAHWLGRLEPRQTRIELLLPMLSDADAGVRLRAAALLAGFDELEVRHHLHMAALQDHSEEVRRQAVASLQGMRREDLLDFLLQEVCDVHSPYRKRAVETLRIFPTVRTVEALSAVVEDGQSPADLRRLAIGALAGFEIPKAAQALVDISLRDADSEDRLAALDEVSASRSPAVLGNLLGIVREQTLQQDRWWGPGRFGAWRAFGRLAACVGLIFANGFVHGALLLALRRWWSAIGLITLEALGIALLVTGWEDDSGAILLQTGLVVLMATWLFGFFAPLHVLLRDRKNRRPRPGSLEGTLGVVLFLTDALLPSFLVHGFLRAAAGRYRKALAIFATELAGLGILYLAFVRPQLFYIYGTDFAKPLYFDVLLKFYTFVGWAMFFLSWLYDVAGTASDLLVSGRNALSERLMGNPLAAGMVLDLVTSPDPAVAGWARGMVRRYRTDMPPELLLDRIAQADRGSRRLLIPGLVAKRGDAVEVLEARMRSAEPSMRLSIIGLLVRRPTEQSLKALWRLWPELALRQRLRTMAAVWHWRVRVWPKSVLTAIFLLLPLLGLLGYEGWMIKRHPERSQMRMLRDREAKVRSRLGAAEFLAKAYPWESYQQLLSTFDQNDLEEVRLGVVDSLAMAAAETTDLDPSGKETRPFGAIVAESLANRLARGESPVLARAHQQRRERTAAGLHRIAGANPAAVTGSRAAPALLAVLRDPREDLAFRQTVLDVLQAAGAAGAIEQFLAVSLQRRATLAGSYVELTARGQATADEEALRFAAVQALGRMGTLPAYESLHRLGRFRKTMPADLRAQLDDSLKDPLRRLKEDLEAERFDVLLRDAPAFREAFRDVGDPEGRRREAEALRLMARAKLESGARLPEREAANATYLRDEAIAFFDEANGIEPLPAEDRMLLAEALIAKGNQLSSWNRQEEASKSWLRALEADPSLPKARRSLLLIQAGRPDLAEAEALAAVEKDARDPLAYTALRRSLLERGEGRKAEQVFQGLSAVPSGEPLARFNLAIVYSELATKDPQAFTQAYDEMERLVLEERRARRQPPVAWLANFAELSLTTGRYGQAESVARELLADKRVPPGSVMALNLECLRYVALVLADRKTDAGKALAELEDRHRRLDAGTENGWTYSGVETYLRRDVQLPQALLQELVMLIDTVKKPDPGSRAAYEVFEANRAALRASVRADGKKKMR
jgi:tetratricopeptide (TPR) repeat protein